MILSAIDAGSESVGRGKGFEGSEGGIYESSDGKGRRGFEYDRERRWKIREREKRASCHNIRGRAEIIRKTAKRIGTSVSSVVDQYEG